MNDVRDDLRTALRARHPVLLLQTPEEDRAFDALVQVYTEMFPGRPTRVWNALDGFEDSPGEALREPAAAVRSAIRAETPGLFIMKDLAGRLGDLTLARALREAHRRWRDAEGRVLAMIHPVAVVPAELTSDIFVVEVPLPGPEELLAEVHRVRSCYPHAHLPPGIESQMVLALRGLTIRQVRHLMHGILAREAQPGFDLLEQIFQEKKRLVRHEEYLEYIPRRVDLARIGGLENVKEWALNRKGLFTWEAVEKGLPIPRGVLIMGVSGCGKSMTAKALAALWDLPLFRLDMNLIFSGLYGSPHAAFHRALKAIEAVAPAVLWIDEIENALGMTVESATAEQSLTFSSFLTWMQERPPLVFVAATANRIESLPAEVIRKGRFDQVFFCDLPDAAERRDIIRIHLEANGARPGDVDPERLLNSTKGWSGAEIEQAIVSARIDAVKEGRPFTTEDVLRHTLSMVPLSETMAEQVRAIRSWAFNRATRASRKRDAV